MNDSVLYTRKNFPAISLADMFTDAKTKRMVTRFEPILKSVMGIKRIEGCLYDAYRDRDNQHLSIWCKFLEQLNIAYQVHRVNAAKMPQEGGLIIIANHPFGMLDGIIMGSLLRSQRDDIKIMANQALLGPKLLGVDIIGVDPYENNSSIKANLSPLRQARRWLNQGGVVAVFPGGDVSVKEQHKTVDPPWHKTLLRFIQKSKTPIMPVYFQGQNSEFFYKLRGIHEKLGSCLLGKELLKKHGQTIDVFMGPTIDTDTIKNEDNLEQFLRDKIYSLEHER